MSKVPLLPINASVHPHSIDKAISGVSEDNLPPVEEAENEDALAEADANDEQFNEEIERRQLQELIEETGFMMMDYQMPVDTETQRNTLHNALLYQMSEEELREMDPKYISDSDTERLMMSPEVVSSPVMVDSVPSLPLSPISSSEFSVCSEGTDNAVNFHRGVTLDTFNTTAHDLSKYQITLTLRHKDYKYTKSARTLICTYDEKQMSLAALRWTMKEMVSDFDTLVVFSVLDPELDMALVRKNHRQRAEHLLNQILQLNERDQKIKIVLEFKVGNVQYMVSKAMRDYDPTFLIVGTNGNEKTGFKSLIAPKSMSKSFLQLAKMPVISLRRILLQVSVEGPGF
ncbi:hypothetical protein FOA43_000441 [Brettanomyces nanus]|uniref:UspA domain-containing protein n=1 Tax=Eeniella nana TaxID=13502 RepID=A0A875RYK3_EENNA|nr:uncharacterized protein FOA43_000441 [Brettanomyces nanus]QPG73135.1 hypothetical protein FOA43_000441 [Brettanomyces nanus]